MSTNSGKKTRSRPSDYSNISGVFREPTPLNEAQSIYLNAIKTNNIIFGIGSAGTGKTFLAANYAAEQLFYKKIDKIIITRPVVETGRSLGFTPGTLDEKFAVYLDPFADIFSHSLGKGFYEYCLKNGSIDPKPMGFMRGSTFGNAIVLVDECQQATKVELKMLLSRIGKNCKMILSGDPSQSDIPNSGLLDAVNRLSHIDGVSVVEFTEDDIVRSKMAKQVILAYNN